MDYFTADPHYGWGLTTRGFSTPEEHDEELLDQTNSLVQWNDRLFILGDFAKRAADSYRKKIRCLNVHLVWGNHDKNSYASQFKSVQDVCEIKIGEHYCWLSHYAHAYWPRSHRGSLHLYGHNHSRYEAILDAAFPGRRSMDCCVDQAKKLYGGLRPFSSDEILEQLLVRPGHDHPSSKRELAA